MTLVDDSDFAARSLNNWLWTTFTRSNPARDVGGIESETVDKHWGCRGSLVIDARIKPHHAPPLIEDRETTAKVDARAAHAVARWRNTCKEPAMSDLSKVFGCDAPVALVTGSGAARVGRAIAVELASHGCRIALHANHSVDQAREASQELQDQFGVKSIVTQGALDDDSVPPRLVTETVEAFGRLDILVNSAAIWWPTEIDEITAEEAKHLFRRERTGFLSLCPRSRCGDG